MTTQDRAFPIVVPSDHNWHIEGGLTKREYYACAAMAAVVSNENSAAMSPHDIAEFAVDLADALRAALAPAQPVNDNDNESGGK